MGRARPGTWTLAAFAAEYKVLRTRDLIHEEIAEILGLAVKSVGRNVTRARHAGLLPPYNPRENHELLARRNRLTRREEGRP
jgi:hypothetical protein